MMVRKNIDWELGWDPRRHEEFRKSPKNKIHIRKVISEGVGKVREFSGRVPEISRRFRKVPGWGHLTYGAHMDQGGGAEATWAGRTIPRGPHGAELERKAKTLGDSAWEPSLPKPVGPRAGAPPPCPSTYI